MKLLVKKLDLLLVLLWLIVYPFYIPHEQYYYIFQLISALLIFLFTCQEFFKIPLHWLISLYPLTICISCIINRNKILYTQVGRGITGAIIIIDIFCLLHKYIRKFGTELLYDRLYNICKLYTILNIIWIIVLLIAGKLEDAIQNGSLFSKGKFSVAYMFIFFLMYFCINWKGNRLFSFKSKKTIFIILCILMFALCQLIECSTGMMGILIILIMMLLPIKWSEWVTNPLSIIILLSFSVGIILVLGLILNLPFVQYFIVNILHNDIELTGRMMLYKNLNPLVKGAGLWGSGFGSYVTTQLFNGSIYDAQNGLIEIELNYGILGTLFFILLCVICAANKKNFIKPLSVTIFCFIVIAIVEIPFGTGFIFLLALLLFSDSKKIEKESQLPTFVTISLKKW